MNQNEMEDIRTALQQMDNEIKKKNSDNVCVLSEDEKKERNSCEFGLCLGGGGGKGAYQIGVFSAMEEFGLIPRIKCISGASIGALNELLFVGGSVDNSYAAWDQIDLGTVFTPEADLIFNGVPGIFSRNEMEKLIDKYVNFDLIKSGEVTLFANATIVKDDKKTARYFKLNDYDKQDIKTIVTASSSIPLVYERVKFKDMELIDGGLSDNLPVKPVYDTGIRHIILVGLNPQSKKKLDKYSNCDFIEIYPSVTLGDLFDGTLNFSKDAVKFRKMLGYKDAIRAFKVYFECDAGYIANLENQKNNDINEIKAELKYDSLNDRINKSMQKFNSLSDKYI